MLINVPFLDLVDNYKLRRTFNLSKLMVWTDEKESKSYVHASKIFNGVEFHSKRCWSNEELFSSHLPIDEIIIQTNIKLLFHEIDKMTDFYSRKEQYETLSKTR